MLAKLGARLSKVASISCIPWLSVSPFGVGNELCERKPHSVIQKGLSRPRVETKGIVLEGFEPGNEINWAGFNADFSLPGEDRVLDMNDLTNDPEGKRVAKGFLQYIKLLGALKDIRDHSKLNQHTPIISAGLADLDGSNWPHQRKADVVSVSVTIDFFRAHGLERLVDGWHSQLSPIGRSREERGRCKTARTRRRKWHRGMPAARKSDWKTMLDHGMGSWRRKPYLPCRRQRQGKAGPRDEELLRSTGERGTIKGVDLLCLAWRLACGTGESRQRLPVRLFYRERLIGIGTDVVHCVQAGGKRSPS